MIFGETRAGGIESIGTTEAADGASCGIDAEEVSGGFLSGGEIDAVLTPVEQVRVFVEVFREQARLAALGGNRGKIAVE